MKRFVDIFVSLCILIVTFPILVVVGLGIKLTSSGPIFYQAKRAGLGDKPFTMFKFRTMHVSDSGPVITGANDTRIFQFGRILRKLKLDEIPQFVNVLTGDMSVVGPRPEDPVIVARAYTPWMRETLNVRPGITSPGAIYYYAFGEALVSNEDPEISYIENLLPPKIAIDLAYISRANIISDIGVALRTAWAILAYTIGVRVMPSKKDILTAENWAVIPLETN